MKWILILLLTLSVVVLGCNPIVIQREPTIEEQEQLKSSGKKLGVWLTDWNEAMKMAQSLARPVLVDFTGSDWCIWCQKLEEEVFSKDEFTKYAKDNFILLKVDFPREIEQSDELKAFNQQKLKEYKVEGFPTIVIINEKSQEIARTGYRPGGAEKYIKHLEELLNPPNPKE
jgi:protein disulfide-isomerase